MPMPSQKPNQSERARESEREKFNISHISAKLNLIHSTSGDRAAGNLGANKCRRCFRWANIRVYSYCVPCWAPRGAAGAGWDSLRTGTAMRSLIFVSLIRSVVLKIGLKKDKLNVGKSWIAGRPPGSEFPMRLPFIYRAIFNKNRPRRRPKKVYCSAELKCAYSELTQRDEAEDSALLFAAAASAAAERPR